MMDRCLLHTSDVHSPQKQRGNTWQLEKFRSFPAVPAVGGRSNPVPHVPHLRLRIATVILFQTPSTSGSILQTGYMGSAKGGDVGASNCSTKAMSIRCGCPTNTSRPITIIKSLHLLHPITPLYNPLNLSF